MALEFNAAERLSDNHGLPPWTILEHRERYDFAARWVAGKDVVDCACGTGAGTAVFAQAGARSILGIDLSEEALQEARRRCQAPQVSFVKGDGVSIPLPSASADVFISLETIEHIENDAAFLDEVHRVLKPGGTLICSTPNRVVTNPGTSIDHQPWNPFHVREYSLAEFSALLERRFRVTGVYGQNPVWRARIGLMALIARFITPMLAVRLNQVLKCRWFLWDKQSNHPVLPIPQGRLFEYATLVCERP